MPELNELPDHLTYEDTGHPYPWQYEKIWNPGAPTVYYTELHYQGMQEFHAKHRRHQPISDQMIDDVKSSLTKTKRSRHNNVQKAKESRKKTSICETCGKEFTPETANVKTCSRPCADDLYRLTQDRRNEKRRAKRAEVRTSNGN